MTSPTFLVALILGSIMLAAAIWVYVQHRAFGLGGTVLTVFGAILLGMPVWRTVDVSIDETGVKAKFEQLEAQISQVQKGTETRISQVQQRTESQISQVQQRTTALEYYEAVQALYGESKNKMSCDQYRRIVDDIKAYVGNNTPVPESFRYTVRYPSLKPMPTVSDLATDRITRIRQVYPQCFR